MAYADTFAGARSRAARRWEDAERSVEDAYLALQEAKSSLARARKVERVARRAFLLAEEGQSNEYDRVGQTPRSEVGRLAMQPVCSVCRGDLTRDAAGYVNCSLDGNNRFLCDGCAWDAMTREEKRTA